MTEKNHDLKIAMVQFPGSNCDRDCITVFKREFGIDLQLVWHTETQLPADSQGVLLPGGFSYGDYLRGGSLASHSAIMDAVKSFANNGGPVFGICNGFQILTECHLLPGMLLPNRDQKFICRSVYLKTEPAKQTSVGARSFAKHLKAQGAAQTYYVPIAHGEGRYYVPDDLGQKLMENGQVLFQYAGADGSVSENENPNGSYANIAGICNESGNIIGMMPHPERAAFSWLGEADKCDGKQYFTGKPILQAFVNLCQEYRSAQV